jgi:hypothetical protein
MTNLLSKKIAVITLAVTAIPVMGQWLEPLPEPGFDRAGHANWVKEAKPQLSADQDKHQDVRDERAAVYHSMSGMPVALDDPKNAHLRMVCDFSYAGPVKPDLPVFYADLAIVGTAFAHQSYLSADHTRVYTELEIKAEEIIKDTSGSLKPGETITLLQNGGTLTLSSGQTVSTSPCSGEISVRMNVPHLLFLKYLPKAKAYEVFNVWDVSGPQPHQLDRDGRAIGTLPEAPTREGIIAATKRRNN